jgi:predicted nucleic acid-binding protein
MKIFLDANILVAVLNKEYPLFTYASRILSLADSGKFEIYTSPICLAIAFYFAEKKSGATMAKKKIEILTKNISISDADRNVVLNAVQNKSVIDFEDGLEYYSAMKSKCRCIVTEDLDDFHFSKIEILRSEEFLQKYVMIKKHN